MGNATLDILLSSQKVLDREEQQSYNVHCQLELQGTAENRSLLAGGVAFDILVCWKDDHLQTSEYSLQDKYKGEVTNKTENVISPAEDGIFFAG